MEVSEGDREARVSGEVFLECKTLNFWGSFFQGIGLVGIFAKYYAFGSFSVIIGSEYLI